MAQRPEPALRVEVVYASAAEQAVRELSVPAGASVREAVERSGLLQQFPEIRPGHAPVGIFGRRVSWEDPVSDRDRVEIYRALLIDPKAARRARARKPRASS